MQAELRSSILSVVIVVCLATSIAVGASGYAIDASGAIEGPSQTFSVDDRSYTVESVLVVDPGETGSFDVDAPANESYRLYRYDSEGSIHDSTRGTGPETFEHSFDGVGPGSYVMAVVPDSETRPEVIHPVLVRGYDLAVQTSVEDETAVVTVEATRTAENADPIEELTVSVETNDGVRNVTATERGDGYRAEFSLNGFEAGEHRLLAVARGDRAFQGEREVLALERSTLTIPDDDRTDTETTTTSAIGGETTTETTTPPPSTTETTVESTTTTEAAPTSTTADTTTADRTTVEQPTTTETPAGGGPGTSTESDGVIQPRSETPTTSSGPGFTPVVGALAILVGTHYWRRP